MVKNVNMQLMTAIRLSSEERRVQRVRKAIEPIGNSLPDWQIIRDLSTTMGY